MSQAKDKFFELLAPTLVELGYSFKKSKGSFEKTKGDLCYSIIFNWDGRGGTTSLKSVIGKVHLPAILKASIKLVNIHYNAAIWQKREVSCLDSQYIPPMYSKKLIELANKMAFKEMAAMPFEEKYPIEKITKSVEIVKNMIINGAVPFHTTINNEMDILNYYIEKAKIQLDTKDFGNICYYVFPIKLMCKKLKIEEPPSIKEINLFTKKSIDNLWNLQSIDFKQLEKQFNEITF